jgi:hypothetical protein
MLEQNSEDRLLREDLYALENRLDTMEAQIFRLPTQRDLTSGNDRHKLPARCLTEKPGW